MRFVSPWLWVVLIPCICDGLSKGSAIRPCFDWSELFAYIHDARLVFEWYARAPQGGLSLVGNAIYSFSVLFHLLCGMAMEV